MKNEPIDGRTSFVKKLKASHFHIERLPLCASIFHRLIILKKYIYIITIIAIIIIVITIVLMITIITMIIITIIMIVR